MAANPASMRLLEPTPLLLGQIRSAWLNRPAGEVIKHSGLKAWMGRLKEIDNPPFLHVDKGPESEYDLLCHVTTLDLAAIPREYLVTLINVTEFRNLDRIKSEFVANASHELKTPLSSIKGYAETLLDGALGDDKVREPFVRKIHSNALRLELLILDLLSLSQLEAHPLPKDTEPLPLRVFVNAAINLHRQELDSVGIRLDNQVPDTAMVLVEPRDLELILNNLIGNAIRYNKPGGKVKVWVESREDFHLFIKDTGIGIPEEMLGRIFERFYRAGASRASKEGTGLGLAIVKHAASKYGMTVTVESTLGEGSLFQVSIPRLRVGGPTV
jgi:two-component system phosphate regulon sensor histidine kinase PhoR